MPCSYIFKCVDYREKGRTDKILLALEVKFSPLPPPSMLIITELFHLKMYSILEAVFKFKELNWAVFSCGTL